MEINLPCPHCGGEKTEDTLLKSYNDYFISMIFCFDCNEMYLFVLPKDGDE